MTVEQALSIGDVIYNNGTLRSFEVIGSFSPLAFPPSHGRAPRPF